MILYKNVPGKKSFIVESMGTKYSKYRWIEKKYFLRKRLRLDHIFTKLRTFFLFFFLRIYFLQDYISFDLISWDFIGSPHTILGKKVLGIENSGLYFQWHFVLGLKKIGTFLPKLIFPGFFPKKLSGDVLNLTRTKRVPCKVLYSETHNIVK